MIVRQVGAQVCGAVLPISLERNDILLGQNGAQGDRTIVTTQAQLGSTARLPDG